MAETNVGSPKGREPYGDGGLVVVVGSHAPPGRAGKPSAGRSCAVSLSAGLLPQGAEVREEVPLGHPPYLNGKPEGDNSMAGKRGRCEGVDGVAAQDPCDMAKT